MISCLFPHGEDCTGGNIAVDIRRAVQRVESDGKWTLKFNLKKGSLEYRLESTCMFFIHYYWFLILFRYQYCANVGVNKGVNEHFIGQNVQLLLRIASRILASCSAI